MRELKDIFWTQESDGVSRRGLLRGAGALSALAMLAALPSGGGAEAAERNSGLDMRDMRHYSEDPNHRGIGVFINLQADSPMTGDEIGQWLQRQFGSLTPPVPVEYRYNQSRGTATDITFYVRGKGFPVNVGDLQAEMPQVLAHHNDVWLRQTTSLKTLDQ